MEEKNNNVRLEAFCDGVFAIALTLLIIDIKLPSTENIHTNADLLLALKHLTPSILAFLLSFIVILITWVNNHAALKLVHKSSSHFIYANGLLLLGVVFVPFPTSLLGEFVLTNHAGPAVALYSAVFGLQAIAWILMTRAALNPANPLLKTEKAIRTGRLNLKRAYYATVLYTICAIVAFWFPLAIAIFVALTWIAWLLIGISIKE
ncbi:MAG: TMEM175 family protein [Bacteroidota bacterium]